MLKWLYILQLLSSSSRDVSISYSMFQNIIIAFATEYNVPKSPIMSSEIRMNVKCLGSDIWQLKNCYYWLEILDSVHLFENQFKGGMLVVGQGR